MDKSLSHEDVKCPSCGTAVSRERTCTDCGHSFYPDKDFDEFVTPFPENYIVFWSVLALLLVTIRITAMAFCGEATGRLFINFLFAVLPSTLAILIVIYSKSMERMTLTFCDLMKPPREKTVDWCKKNVRFVFSNLGMFCTGVLFLIFAWAIYHTELYPTVTNNAQFARRALDSSDIDMGFYTDDTAEYPANMKIMAWARLPLGTARKLMDRGRAPTLFDETGKYPGPPDPKHNLQILFSDEKLPPVNRVSDYFNIKNPPVNQDNMWQWTFSRVSFMSVVVMTMFMGGAMFWCLCGMIHHSVRLARKDNIVINIFPHPLKSIKSVGTFLGFVALTNSLIYTAGMIGIYMAQPDPLLLGIGVFFAFPTIILFLVPQYYLHKVMAKIKYEKISLLDDQLNKALDDIKDDPSERNHQQAKAIIDLQHGLALGSEWPFDMQAMLAVVGSILIPLGTAIFTVIKQF